MTKFKSTIALALVASLAIMATPAAAKSIGYRVCKKVSDVKAGSASAVGTLVAAPGAIANGAGIAALTHSSGAAILSSVGVGGTGYLAGTLGTVATVFGVLSSPLVFGTGAVVALGATSVGTYCHFRK